MLPALSGLARRFVVAFDESSDGGNSDEKLYAAGLWRPDLHRWLTWALDNERACPYQPLEDVQRDACEPDTYVAPSWSWVGRRQAVNMATMSNRGIPEIDTDDNDDNVKIIARVVDFVCEACTADEFGQMAASATLMMETKVVCLGESHVVTVSLAHRPEAAQGKFSSATLTVDLGSDMPLEMHLDWAYTVINGDTTWQHLTLALIGYYMPEVVMKGPAGWRQVSVWAGAVSRDRRPTFCESRDLLRASGKVTHDESIMGSRCHLRSEGGGDVQGDLMACVRDMPERGTHHVSAFRRMERWKSRGSRTCTISASRTYQYSNPNMIHRQPCQ